MVKRIRVDSLAEIRRKEQELKEKDETIQQIEAEITNLQLALCDLFERQPIEN